MLKFHSKHPRQIFTRKTCSFLPSAQNQELRHLSKLYHASNPLTSSSLQPPHICDFTLYSSMVLTACIMCHSPCNIILSLCSLLNKGCRLGVPRDHDHWSSYSDYTGPFLLPHLNSRKIFHNGEEQLSSHLSQPLHSQSPFTLHICYHLPILKLCSLPAEINHIPLPWCLGCMMDITSSTVPWGITEESRHSLKSPTQSCMLNTNRMPNLYSSIMASKKKIIFKLLLSWSDKDTFCRGRESIDRLSYFRIVSNFRWYKLHVQDSFFRTIYCMVNFLLP